MKLLEKLARFRTPIEVEDRQLLAAFCNDLGLDRLGEIPMRVPVVMGGEIQRVRLVPRPGASALEITVTDGSASIVAIFLGRRTVPGMIPGRRLLLQGVALHDGERCLVYNPSYQLLSQ